MRGLPVLYGRVIAALWVDPGVGGSTGGRPVVVRVIHGGVSQGQSGEFGVRWGE